MITIPDDDEGVRLIATAIYDHEWFGGGSAGEWLTGAGSGRETMYAGTARAIISALQPKGNNTMSNFTIYFTQTEVQPVQVKADTLEEAQALAAKHICRIGLWDLNTDQYSVDGRLVTTQPA